MQMINKQKNKRQNKLVKQKQVPCACSHLVTRLLSLNISRTQFHYFFRPSCSTHHYPWTFSHHTKPRKRKRSSCNAILDMVNSWSLIQWWCLLSCCTVTIQSIHMPWMPLTETTHTFSMTKWPMNAQVSPTKKQLFHKFRKITRTIGKSCTATSAISVTTCKGCPLDICNTRCQWRLWTFVMSWSPKFNGSHFGLPPSSIHRTTGLGGNFVQTTHGVWYSHRLHLPRAATVQESWKHLIPHYSHC